MRDEDLRAVPPISIIFYFSTGPEVEVPALGFSELGLVFFGQQADVKQIQIEGLLWMAAGRLGISNTFIREVLL